MRDTGPTRGELAVSKRKTEPELTLQGAGRGRKVRLMKGKAASAAGSRSDIHLFWVDIQTCIITCWAT
jgi:hypothetical protein